MHPLVRQRVVGSCHTTNNESVKWFCQICDVLLTSRSQAAEHYFGRRHQNVIKTNQNFHMEAKNKSKEVQSSSESSDVECSNHFDGNFESDPDISSYGTDSILDSVVKSENKTFYSSDLSIYRTPSGEYYCQPCDRTVHYQAQFLQHLESRKHKQKAGRAFLKLK